MKDARTPRRRPSRGAPIACLALDLDDTLYPERQYVVPGMEAAARELVRRFGPVADFQAELVRFWEAEEPGPTFDTVLQRLGLRPDRQLIDDLVAAYRGREVLLRPYPDVKPALEFWRDRLPLAIITDGHAPGQRKKLASLDLEGFFREVVLTGQLGPGCAKPSPEPFRLIERRLGFRQAGLYVGDNPRLDVPGCRQLGWTTVWIVRPDARRAPGAVVDSCRPDYVIRDLTELRDIPGLGETTSEGPGASGRQR